MTLTEKLDKFMDEKGLSRYQLSHNTGVPYTTIVGYYTRGYDNAKLSNLRAIANYMGCSLDYLCDDRVEFDLGGEAERQEFIRLYENADSRARKAIDSLIKPE